MNKWYLDGDKRRYDIFGSFPKESMCPKNVYNMWKPFPVQLNDMSGADISKCEDGLKWFNNHIAVLCDHQEEVINFVKDDVSLVLDGNKVPVIFVSIQRWSEFTKIWEYSDKYGNIQLPFISVVRKPHIQVGTNQNNNWNLPKGVD